MKSWAAIAMLGVALTACGNKAPAPGNTVTAAPGPDARDPMEDKIRALDDVGRKITFYRAILDADFKCKKIMTVTELPRDAGFPVWQIGCDDGAEFRITLAPGGVFNVSGVPTTRPRFPKATATVAPIAPPPQK